MIALPLVPFASPYTEQSTCWADCWAPGHGPLQPHMSQIQNARTKTQTDPSQLQIRLVPNWFAKELNFWHKKPFFEKRGGGGELLGRKVLPNSCRSDFFLLCHLRTFVQVWMSTTLQRGFWWGFGTCWDTNMLYMYTTIYNYMTCNACIHLRLYEMYNIYIYIFTCRSHPTSS